jgi:hypothetical protein
MLSIKERAYAMWEKSLADGKHDGFPQTLLYK